MSLYRPILLATNVVALNIPIPSRVSGARSAQSPTFKSIPGEKSLSRMAAVNNHKIAQRIAQNHKAIAYSSLAACSVRGSMSATSYRPVAAGVRLLTSARNVAYSPKASGGKSRVRIGLASTDIACASAVPDARIVTFLTSWLVLTLFRCLKFGRALDVSFYHKRRFRRRGTQWSSVRTKSRVALVGNDILIACAW